MRLFLSALRMPSPRPLYHGRLVSAASLGEENLFRLLVESAKDYAIFVLDPAGHVATWNEGAANMKGYTSEEIIGQHFSRFYPQKDVAAGKCEMELRVAAAEGRFEDEGIRLRKNGSPFLLAWLPRCSTEPSASTTSRPITLSAAAP